MGLGSGVNQSHLALHILASSWPFWRPFQQPFYIDLITSLARDRITDSMGGPITEERVREAQEDERSKPSDASDLEKTTSPPSGNLVYENVDEEPVIHIRTWIALASMFLMNFVQTFALQGPPSVVSKPPISS